MGRIRSLFSFKGRTTRRGYWRIQLWLAAAAAVVWCGSLVLAIDTGIGAISATGLGAVAVALVISCATMVRRLHDRDKSAWWVLPLYAAPVGVSIPLRLAGDYVDRHPLIAAAASLLVLGLWAWGFIELGWLKGTRGPNRFGVDPLAPELEPSLTATFS